MFCKNCGENNLDGSLFCKSCGERLVAESFKQEAVSQGTFSNDTMPLNMVQENKANNTFFESQPAPKIPATLVDCSVCGKKISSKAHICPNCGNMTAAGEKEVEKEKTLKTGFWGGVYWLLSSAMFLKALYYWLTIERHSSFRYYNDGEAVQLVFSVIMMIVIAVIDIMVCVTTTKGNQK